MKKILALFLLSCASIFAQETTIRKGGGGAGGSATNAVATVRKDGTPIVNGATAIDFTNAAGSVVTVTADGTTARIGIPQRLTGALTNGEMRDTLFNSGVGFNGPTTNGQVAYFTDSIVQSPGNAADFGNVNVLSTFTANALADFGGRVTNSTTSGGGFWTVDSTGFISLSDANNYILLSQPQGGIVSTLDLWSFQAAGIEVAAWSTNTSKVNSNLWVVSTNLVGNLTFTGGSIPTNSILGTGGNTNVVPITIGSGLSLTAGTLTATGGGGGGSSSNFFDINITNTMQRTVWRAGSTTNLTIPWGVTNRVIWHPASNAGLQMSGTSGGGTNEQIIHLTVCLTNSGITSVVMPTNELSGLAPFFKTAPSTNEFDLVYNGDTFYIVSYQSPTTGTGETLVVNTNPVVYTPTIRQVPTVVTGVGGANTNFTLLATQPEVSINGFTNVSIRAVMGYDAALVDYWTCVITNGSGSSRTLEFSAVTNKWRFNGVYGTNAPNTLTNATRLEISGRQHGTNVQVLYSYTPWP